MIHEIKNKNGVTIATARSLTYSSKRMGEEYVMATFRSPVPIDFNIGDYITYRGANYYLNVKPSVKKRSSISSVGDAFTYDSVKFSSVSNELVNCSFRDIVLFDNQLHTALPNFAFMTNTAADLADRIQANLNALGTGWSVVCTDAVRRGLEGKKNINISANNINCWEALALVNSEFDLNFSIHGRTITIGKVENVLNAEAMRYGLGNGLVTIEKTTDSNQQVITRLRAYGNTTNMPTRYYANIGVSCRLPINKGTILKYKKEWKDGIPTKDESDYILSKKFDPSKVVEIIKSGLAGEGDGCMVFPSDGYLYSFGQSCFNAYDSETGSAIIRDGSGEEYVVVVTNSTSTPAGYPYYAASIILVKKDVDESFFEYMSDIEDIKGASSDNWPVGIKTPPTSTMSPNLHVDHLMLPSFPATQDPYLESDNISELGVREATVFFDGSNGLEDIHPTIENLAVNVVSASGFEGNGIYGTDTTAETIPPFTVVIEFGASTTPFDPWEQKIVGETAYISMKSGMCQGRQFEITGCKKLDERTFELTCKREEEKAFSRYFPYSDYPISESDTFVLLGIGMPDAYVIEAARKLEEAARKYLEENSKVKYNYALNLSSIFMQKQVDAGYDWHDTICAGQSLVFEDADIIGSDAISIPIESLEIKEGEESLPKYTIVLSDSTQVSTISKVQSEIKSVASQAINTIYPLAIKSNGKLVGTYNPAAKGMTLELMTNAEGETFVLNRLDAWDDYDADKAEWVLSALLGIDLKNKIEEVKNAKKYIGTTEVQDAPGEQELAGITSIDGDVYFGDKKVGVNKVNPQATLHVGGNAIVDNDAVIEGNTLAKGGIDIGNFVKDASGATIDKDGNAEFESIKGRGFLEVPEIRFNRASLVVGTDIQSPCGGVIRSVEKTGLYGGIAELELGDDDMFGSIQEGALCWGYFHDINDNRNNSDIDLDDRRGNITYRGFATVYFQIAKILDETHCTKFRYELRPGTTLHPYVGMNFGGRGNTNINEKSLQSFTIKTPYYEASYQLVTNWDWNEPEKHVVKVSGNLDGFEALAGKTSWPQSPFFGTIETNLLYRGNLEKVDNDTRFIYITQSSNGMLLTGETETVSFKVRDFAFQDRTKEFTFTINGVALPKSEDPFIDISFDELTEDLTEFSVEATDDEYTLSSSFTERRLVFDYHLDVLKTAVDTSASFDFGMEFNDGSSLDMNDGVPVVFVGNGDDIYAVRRIGKEDSTYGILFVQMDDYLPTEISNREQVSVNSNVKSVTFIWYADSSRSKEITRVKVPVINQQNSYVIYHDAVVEGDRPRVPSVGQPIGEYGWYEGLKATSVWMSAKTSSNIGSGAWGEAVKIAGEDGNSVAIKGSVETESELLLITASDGDGYIVNATGHLWVYYSGTDTWTDVGVIKGQNGKNAYVHIKYSPDGKTFSANNGETPAAWIGTYADDNAMDSTVFADYAWKKIEGASSFVSFVFKRSVNAPAAPSGGTFSSPVPAGWEDGIPTAGVGAVWMSKRTFFSDDRDTASWTSPKQMTDTADFDVCYHKGLFGEGEIEPAPPSKSVHPTQGENPDSWHDTALVDDVWMATSECHNGVWSDWQVFRIKGEKGDKGEDADTYELVVYKAALNPLGEMELGITFNSGDSIDLDNGKSLEAIADGDEVSAVRKFRYEETTQGNLYYQFDGNARVKINNHDVVTVKSGIKMVTFTWTNDADVEIARKDIPVVSNGTSITSFVFKLAPSKPAKPVLGSYDEPVPLSEGWTDGIPQGEGILWMTKRIFWNDGRTNGDWSEPKQMTDTETLDICYNNSETKPQNPLYHNVENQGNGWYNTATDAAVWMAIARKKNDVWGEWEISKIKGEDGDEYKAIYAFVRSVNAPNAPTGGTFKDPIPVGWSESVPDGDASIPVWQSKRLFCSNADKGEYAWSKPNMIADTSDFDICYHDATTDGKKPTALPTSHHTEDQGNGWKNTPTDKTVWVATAQLVNGTWQAWKVSMFKGEKGKSFGGTVTWYQSSTSKTSAPSHTANVKVPGASWKTNIADTYFGEKLGSAFHYYLWAIVVEETVDSDNTSTFSTKAPQMIDAWNPEKANIAETYCASNNNDTHPTSGWTTLASARGSFGKNKRYIWKREHRVYDDDSTEDFYTIFETYVENGDSFAGTTIWYASNSTKTAPSYTQDVANPSGSWKTNIADTSWGEMVGNAFHHYLFTLSVEATTHADGTTTYDSKMPQLLNVWSADKESIEETYACNNSNTSHPTTGWTTLAGARTNFGESNKYIWKREHRIYEDKSTEDFYTVFETYVKNGKDITITSKSIEYVVSADGKNTPQNGWGTSVPDPQKGKYLWTKTTVNYSDGNSTVSYSVSYYGNDGASITIASKEVAYAISTNAKDAPQTGWSTSVPAAEQGKYLWTRTTVNYSDGKSTVSYSVSYYGKNGESLRVLYKKQDNKPNAPSGGSDTDIENSGWSKTILPMYNVGIELLSADKYVESGSIVANWNKDSDGYYTSPISGDAYNSKSTYFQFILRADRDCILSLPWKINSEAKYDIGNIYLLDGADKYLVMTESGTKSGVFQYSAKAGIYTIVIEYKKDNSTSVSGEYFKVAFPIDKHEWMCQEKKKNGEFDGWSEVVDYLQGGIIGVGDQALEGIRLRYRGVWDSSVAYENWSNSASKAVKVADYVTYGSSKYVRLPKDSGRAYSTTPNSDLAHWKSLSPLGSAYFEFIAAEGANIKFMSGRQITVTDDKEVETAGLQGGSGIQIYAGASGLKNDGTPNNPMFSVDNEGTMVAQRGEFHGVIKAFDADGNVKSAINADGTGTTTYYYPDGKVMQETVFEYDSNGDVSGMKTIYRKSDGSIAWVLDSSGISNTLSEYWTHFDRYELIVDEFGVVGGVGQKIACSRFVSTTSNTAPHNGLTAQGTLTNDSPSSVSSAAKLHGWYHKTGNYKWIQDAHGAIGGKMYYSCEHYERGFLIETINLEGA